MARKGEKLSDATRKKLSESLKGKKTWNKGKKYSVKNRKCSVDGCDNKHEGLGFCRSHYAKFRRNNDPEYREKYRKKSRDGYYKFHEERKKQKRITGKNERAELYRKLGAKCASCGEKFNPDISRSNLEIHHKEYSKEDEEVKAKNKGNLGSRHIYELKRMFKQGVNPKKKFCLLCKQCNVIEAHVRINTTKAFETFCWLFGEGYFDKALKDDPKLKKLTEFLK